jgi:photosystem II stability/assembly factor-like uncharacterized protein
MSLRARIGVSILGLAFSLDASPLAQPDAAQLEFSTYFGGTGADTVTAIRIDAQRNIYLAGSTSSSDLPTRGSLFPAPPMTGLSVGFLIKLRPDRSIVYSTYLERPVVALAVDSSGHAIVAHSLPVSTKAGPIDDVVVSKIAADGSEVIYSVRLAGRGLDRVAAIATDASGGVVVVGSTNSPDFPLLNALQPTVPSGSEREAGGAFITKLDADGHMMFSTGWGGVGEDAATSVAIDRNLDIVVAGTTSSTDFVITPATFQPTLASTTCTVNAVRCGDAFVTRLSPDGQTVRYSTFFGGSNGETVRALALDHLGSPHITGVTASSDLPLRGALQTSCDSHRTVNGCSTYIAKLSPDGSSLQYSTYFGSGSYYVYGPGQVINALSVDVEGNLVAAGTTQGNDLPLIQAFQSVNRGGPLFKSTDDGGTWSASSYGIAGSGVWFLASGGRRSPVYAVPLGGYIFRSDDGGQNWRGRPSSGSPEPNRHFAVDPLTPSTLYATATNALLKSSDAGETWSQLPLDEREFLAVTLAPSSPSHVYAAARRGVFHSPSGGITWSLILDTHASEGMSRPYVQHLAVHPRDADSLYALFTDGSVMKRAGGQQWVAIGALECPGNQLVFAEDLPSTMYARACGKVVKSVDEGRSWRVVGFPERTAAWIAMDPSMPNAIYAASAHNGVFRSRDRGETWTMIREPLDQDIRSILVDPSSPATIYIGATAASNAFIARFNPSGALTLSTYLGGLSAAGSSIAIDRNGAILVGGTAGREFPLVRPIQPQYGGAGDAFLARVVDR